MNIYPMDIKTHKAHNDEIPNLYCGSHYLHGELERMNGYDIFCIREKDEKKLEQKVKGIERVTAIFPNGNKVEADFYFWTIKLTNTFEWLGETIVKECGSYIKGLVVLPDDTEGVAYARKKYEENAKFL